MGHHFERVMSVDQSMLPENKEKPSTQGNLPLVFTFNKTLPNIKTVKDKHWHIPSINENFEKFLIKNHLLLIEEIPICTNKSEGIASLKTKLYVKTPNNQNNEDIAHCASQDRTIFVVNK